MPLPILQFFFITLFAYAAVYMPAATAGTVVGGFKATNAPQIAARSASGFTANYLYTATGNVGTLGLPGVAANSATFSKARMLELAYAAARRHPIGLALTAAAIATGITYDSDTGGFVGEELSYYDSEYYHPDFSDPHAVWAAMGYGVKVARPTPNSNGSIYVFAKVASAGETSYAHWDADNLLKSMLSSYGAHGGLSQFYSCSAFGAGSGYCWYKYYSNATLDTSWNTNSVPTAQQISDFDDAFASELGQLPESDFNDIVTDQFNQPLDLPETITAWQEWAQDYAQTSPDYSYDSATGELIQTATDQSVTYASGYNNTNPNSTTSNNPDAQLAESGLELPDDYAREETLSSIADVVVTGTGLQEPITESEWVDQHSAGSLYQPLTDAVDSLADPDTYDVLPDLPAYSSSCQQITFSWDGHSVAIPNADACSTLNTAKSFVAWFLYIVTALMIYSAITERRP